MHTLKNLQQLRFYQIPKPKFLGSWEGNPRWLAARNGSIFQSRHVMAQIWLYLTALPSNIPFNQTKRNTHKSHAFLKHFSWWYHIFSVNLCDLHVQILKWHKRMNIQVLQCVVSAPLWVYRQVWLDHVFLCTFSRLEPMNNNQQDKSTTCQAINYMGNSS